MNPRTMVLHAVDSVRDRPKAYALKLVNLGHTTLHAITRGRCGSTFMQKPVLRVTTTGARSGKERTVLLVTPGDYNGDPVIVASHAGDVRNPSWYHNVLAHPEVRIKHMSSGKEERRRARILSSAERAQLWPQFKRDIAPYADYEKKTTREIPLVVLETL